MKETEYKLNGRKYKTGGRTVIVELEGVGDTIKDSFLIMDEGVQEKLLVARTSGFVRAISEKAFTDKDSLKVNLGDKVIFKRYGGTDLNRTIHGSVPKDQPLLRLMEDFEILCVIEDERD